MLFPREVPFVMALLLLGLASNADARCWHGDAAGGDLNFAGEVDGDPFYGQFNEFTVRVCLPEGAAWSESEWTVTVSTGSASTRNRDRDETLHGKWFFAVEDFPTARWVSAQVIERESDLLVEGALEIRGHAVDQSVVIEVKPDDDGLRVSGSAEISRLDLGVGQGEYADPEFIRDRVDLQFELQLLN